MSDTTTTPPAPDGILWGPRLIHLDSPSLPGTMCMVGKDGRAMFAANGEWRLLAQHWAASVVSAIARENQAQRVAHTALCAYLNNTGDAEWAAYVKACDVLRALGVSVPDMDG